VDEVTAMAEEGPKRRLDAAVREAFSWSWGKARDQIRGGKIAVDGETVLDIGREVAAGAEIVFTENARRPRPEDRLLPPAALVHVDREIAVVDKPPFVLTVPWEHGDRQTLHQLLRVVLTRRDKGAGRKRSAGGSELHVVHRLDRNTSGLLVFARTLVALERLKEQFKEHSAQRRYLAIVHGRLAGTSTLESHLVVDRGDGLRGSKELVPRRLKARLGDGKAAVTHVEVIEAFGDATLVWCQLETGRTNQIRIHLSEAGHPLVGETTYLRDYLGSPIPAPRLMLHAAELGFVHPGTFETMRFESPMPAEMAALCESLRKGSPPRADGLRPRWRKRER
jgi:23S rRNA pseudouridine1911/1915/1917 synthase